MIEYIKMDKHVCIRQMSLPPELEKIIESYLYYTPEQIALREIRKRVHFCIDNARHFCSNDYGYEKWPHYLFSYKNIMLYICFCGKCGEYKFSPPTLECAVCEK